MKVLLTIAILLGNLAAANAQGTTTVTATSKLEWESEDYNILWMTIPVVSSYIGEFWLKSNVVNGVPSGPPAITVDWGKPPIGPGNVVSSPPIKPLLQPNAVYVAFVRAVGSASGTLETSPRSNPSDPFGFPSAPKPVVLTVRPTP
jgi:hypothetical protein